MTGYMGKRTKHTHIESQRFRTGLLFILPGAILSIVFVVVPLIMVIYLSFVEWNGISKHIKFVGLKNYINLPEIDGFADMMVSTFVFAFGVTILTITISFIVALVLDKKGRGRINRNVMRSLWFFPSLLSGAIVGILWRIMYNYNNGVLNEIFSAFGLSPVNWLETKGVTNFAIIVGNTWAQVGLCYVIFLAGLQSIPTDLYEAAVLDGASSGQILRKITFPMMAPSITINVVTTSIAAFRAYELPYLISLGHPGKSTLMITQRIYFYGFQAQEYGRASALSVMLTLIITAISLIQLVVLKKREEIY